MLGNNEEKVEELSDEDRNPKPKNVPILDWLDEKYGEFDFFGNMLPSTKSIKPIEENQDIKQEDSKHQPTPDSYEYEEEEEEEEDEMSLTGKRVQN